MSHSSNGILVVVTVFLRVKSTFEMCWFFFPLTVKQQASFPVKVPVASSQAGSWLSHGGVRNENLPKVPTHSVSGFSRYSRFKDRSPYCRKIEICCLIRAFFRTIIDCPKIFQLTFAGCSTESSFFFSPCSTTVYFREAPIVCSFCRHATLLPTKERCVTTQGG